MKKLLLTRLFVGLCAVFSSVSTFAAAGWVGAGAINVNGTWYRADAHESNGWAYELGGNFDEKNLGTITALQLGGQVQLWDTNSADWGTGTAKMYYKFDDAATFETLSLTYYEFKNSNNFFQSGGSEFASSTIDISELSVGDHTLTVYFEDCDGLKPTAKYTANFTKAIDINDAVVTGVNSEYEWTGSAIKPVPTVTYSESELTASKDYDVAYSEGCINVGTYTVTITGKGDYAGTKEVNYDILVPTGYYLVGDMNSWELIPSYQLTENAETSGEYYINNVTLGTGQGFKVVRTDDGKTKNEYFPSGSDNNYTPGSGKFFVYFRPDKKYDSGWHYDYIYATTTASVNVALAPAGYGTYYNSVCEVTLPTGTVAYILTDGSPSYTPTYVEIANGDDDTKTVPAGTAVMLYSASSPVTLTLNTATTDDRTFGSNKLHGSDVATTTTGGDKYYKLTYGSASGYEGRFGWYWGADNGAAFTSPAHKVWLALPAASARTFFGLPGDDVTGINSLTLSKGEGVAYDLQGRRVANPTKGLYIVNGKKVIMK